MNVRGFGFADKLVQNENQFLYPEGERDEYLSSIEKQVKYVVAVVSDVASWTPKPLKPRDLQSKSGILKFGD
jgi:hypothetical protein